ncbi:hypothetical protein Y475_14220 [Listeria monocytogenes]|nr:hypothetical protein [Listeria monocytogenes]
MNKYTEVIFLAPISSNEKQTPFYQAMTAIGHTQNVEGETFYVFSLRLPVRSRERIIMLQSLCSFLRISKYQLIQKQPKKGKNRGSLMIAARRESSSK